MQLETERLYLRELTFADFSELYSVLADSDIMQHYPYTFDENRVKAWITKNIERYQVFGFGLWAVVLKETGELIGDCGITMQSINGSIKPEIGYHINKKFQRQGYAKEAARKCRDWVFANTPFHMIYSYMKKANIASSATAKANGMCKVDEFTDTENEATMVYAITRAEWNLLKENCLETAGDNSKNGTICKAEYKDLQEILELQYLSYQSEADLFGSRKIPPLTQTLDEVRNEYEMGIILKLIDNGGSIIGSVRAKESNGSVYIGKLMVHPQHRCKGYGSQLLLEIERCFPHKRYELFTSSRSKDNIRLYQKVGYEIFDQKKINDELQFVYLEKQE